MVCLGNVCVDTLHKGENDDDDDDDDDNNNNNLFSIPEICQSGYRICQYIIIEPPFSTEV